MKKNEEKEFQLTTKGKVKQIRRWENLPDDLAEQIAKTLIKFAELFYITIARDMSLNGNAKRQFKDWINNIKKQHQIV